MRGFFLSCHVSVRKLMISFDRWRALALPSHWSTRELPNCSGRMCWAFGHDYLMSIVQLWHDYTSSNSQVFREKSAWEEVCVDSLAGNSTQQMWWVLIQLTCFHGKHFTTQVIAWMWNEKVYSFSWHDTVRKLIVSFDRCLPVPSHWFTQSYRTSEVKCVDHINVDIRCPMMVWLYFWQSGVREVVSGDESWTGYIASLRCFS